MFCGKCGAKNEPGAAFCGSCGAPLKEEQPAGNTAASKPAATPKPEASPKPAVVQSSSKHKKIGIAVVAVVVVVAIIAAASLLGGRSDTKTAEQFFDAVFQANPAAIVDLVPEGLVNTVMKQGGYTKEDVAEELESLADELKSSIGFLDFLGDSIKVTYHAVGSEDVDPSRLSYLQEQYKQANVKVSAARDVHVEFRVQADSYDIDETIPFDIPVVKVGNSWYIDVMSWS